MPDQNVNLKNQDCTVIILSYNTKDITDVCLGKAMAAARHSKKTLGNEIKIVVVDNASGDGSCDMIRQKYPDVRLMALSENIGTARGNNIAMKEADTPFMLLLNSDAYLSEDTLEKALKHMAEKPTCDVLCVRQVFGDGSFQSFGGNLPTPWRIIFWTFGVESFPVIKHFIDPVYQYDPGFFDKEKRMEWCSTAFFLVRKEVYDKTGGFDDRLFFYLEDVEWCKRIKDNHFTLCYTPAVTIVHLGGATSKKLSERVLLERHIEGLLHFHKVHYPGTLYYVSWCLYAGMLLRAAFYTMAGKIEKASAYKGVLEKIKVQAGRE